MLASRDYKLWENGGSGTRENPLNWILVNLFAIRCRTQMVARFHSFDFEEFIRIIIPPSGRTYDECRIWQRERVRAVHPTTPTNQPHPP